MANRGKNSGVRSQERTLHRFKDATGFIQYVMRKLVHKPDIGRGFPRNLSRDPGTSAVLFLLGNHCANNGFEPCLVLNKRSATVRQPGDLCCPGGRVSPKIDTFLARIFTLPGFPLARWPYWSAWRHRQPAQAGRMALLLATSLRESLEEMRLNPVGVKFIGPLPAQRLVMFKQKIFPMAGWITRQRRFFPNREVEKIVRVPIRNLLTPTNYGRYRLHIRSADPADSHRKLDDYPCFVHENENESELLWGATYRIATTFLDRVFGSRPPDMETLPVISGVLDENYVRGRRLPPEK